MANKLSSQIQVKSNKATKISSQIRVKSNKARKMSSQIRVKSNIFDLTPIFDLRNAPSNNLPTPTLLAVAPAPAVLTGLGGSSLGGGYLLFLET